MKTAMNIVATIAKAIVVIFAIIGVTATIVTSIICHIYGNHFYDVVEECDNLDPDDEDQDTEITTEAYRRTLSDPRVRRSKLINVVSRGIGKFTSFVANL